MRVLHRLFSIPVLFLIWQINTAAVQGQNIRETDTADIRLESGYKIETYVTGLSLAVSAVFDGDDLIVVESGFANTSKPRIVRISPDGLTEVLAEEGLEAPVTGVLKVNNAWMVSHKGRVSILENGKMRDIVKDLPSNGDHHNNKMVLGRDGKIYLGQGTVTNSAVVGIDNYYFGWLEKHPDAHDIPCRDVTLAGRNFETQHPIRKGETATTGAFLPYGTSSTPGQIIKGDSKCNGAIIRFNPDGSGVEMFAWGLRNPFGIALDLNGQLWTTNHGADTRGSREVANDPDYLVKLDEGAWYGWPDFFKGKLVSSGDFDPLEAPKPQPLFQNHPPLSAAFVTFENHAGANGLAFAPPEFGHQGDAFVAMFGTFTPVTAGFDVTPAGFRIARVDMESRTVSDFAVNSIPGPAYISRHQGFNRPSDVVFGPDGALYVIDFAGGTIDEEGLKFTPYSGVVWRIYRETDTAKRPDGPIVVPAASVDRENIEPFVRLSPELVRELFPQLLFAVVVIVLVGTLIIRSLRNR